MTRKTESAQVGTSGSLWRDAWSRLRGQRLPRACLAVILVYTGLAVYGETVYRVARWQDRTPSYQAADLGQRYLAPGPVRAFAGGRFAPRELMRHPLGTDNLGRDVLQRVVQGVRIAFHVGVITSLIAIPIGVVLGCLAGYFGGALDAAVVWLYSTVACMPGLLFILAIAMLVGKGLTGIYFGIGLTTWVGVCRLIRGEVIKHRSLPYVEAARVMDAELYAPYEYTMAVNMLHKAKEEWGYSDFEAAIDFAAAALEHAEEARKIAKDSPLRGKPVQDNPTDE